MSSEDPVSPAETSFTLSDSNLTDDSLIAGLRAEFFATGSWVSQLSDIDFTNMPDATGIAEIFNAEAIDDPFWEGGPENNFAARYSGRLGVETSGSYTFFLTSDDGSALYIDGERVIDNDGAHRARELSVTLDLEAGAHDIELRYFEKGGLQTLKLEWQGPDSGGVRDFLTGDSLGHSDSGADDGTSTTDDTSATDDTTSTTDDTSTTDGTTSTTDGTTDGATDGGGAGTRALPASGATVEVQGGRAMTLVPEAADVAGIAIVSPPEHGHVSVNPDNTMALVMTRSDHTGPLSFEYEITHADGSETRHNASLEVTPPAQEEGWGTGEGHYMLATDETGRMVVEQGDDHRKIHVSDATDALAAADIAAREGIAESDVTAGWLRDHGAEYGASEGMALSTELGMSLWSELTSDGAQTSTWLLFERGHAYDLGGSLFLGGINGESELHPLLVGAWGTGDAPEILDRIKFQGSPSHNIVIQDLTASKGLKMLGQNENIILDNVTFTGEGSVIQGLSGGTNKSVTIRNSEIVDAWRDEPVAVTDDGKWTAKANRETGLYVSGTDGLLFEDNVFDHNGWAPDFDRYGSIEGGQPPSMYSHNVYIQWNTSDVTMRDSLVMRGSSNGVQFRGGAFVEDNLFIDNNIAMNVLGGSYDGRDFVKNFSLLSGNIVTSAGGRGADAPRIGATDWGIINRGMLTTLDGNIVAHANDPDDAGDTVEGRNSVDNARGEDAVFHDDTVIWRWGDFDSNVEGLDAAALNRITIQRYAAALLGEDSATIEDFAQYVRGLDPQARAEVVQDLRDFFRAGFGIDAAERTDPATLRFIPDPKGDGVRWDNRLNWDSGDLPGTVDGDSVDLGGNEVVYGGTNTVENLHFGDRGGLSLHHGKLTVEGALTAGEAGATLDIHGAGQFWSEGFQGGGRLAVEIDGGRFANTGDFRGPADLTARGGQTILAADGAVYAVTGGSRLEIAGEGAKVGFDGAAGGIAILGFDAAATLAYAADGGLSGIGEFRSGAFGETTRIRSGVDLGGASLELDLSGLEAGLADYALIRADELIGSFGEVSVTGLTDRDAEIVVDYETDAVWLRLTEGSGASELSSVSIPERVDEGYGDVWDALTAGGDYDAPDTGGDGTTDGGTTDGGTTGDGTADGGTTDSGTADTVIEGDDRANVLTGTDGDDVIDGRAGDDRIAGGGGDDALTGGTGADRFLYPTPDEITVLAASDGTGSDGALDQGADRVTDFAGGEDALELDWTGETVSRADSGTDATVGFGGTSVTLEGAADSFDETRDVFYRMAEFGRAEFDHDAVEIALSRSFVDPVVFAMTNTVNGGQPVAVEVSDIRADGMTLRLDEPESLDEIHALEEVTWAVFESGLWELADGTRLEVGTVEAGLEEETGFAWAGFSPDAFDAAPAVLSQIQAPADPDWAVTRQQDADARGVGIALQEEEAGGGPRAPESVGWLAMERGAGAWDGHAWQAGAVEGVTDATTTGSFAPGFSGTPGLLASLASAQGMDTAFARPDAVSASGFDIRAQEETSLDSETDHISEQAHFLALEGEGVLSARRLETTTETDPVIAEVGEVVVDHEIARISLSHAFDDPVVLALAPTENGGQPAATVVSDIASDGFSLRLEEPSDMDGEHLPEAVSWMVVEAGAWRLSDGTVLEAGMTPVAAPGEEGFEDVAFSAGFAERPAIFSQIQDMNGEDWAVTRQAEAGADGFRLGLQEEEARAGSGRAEESVGWFAIERGAGEWDGLRYEAAATGDRVTDRWDSFEFAQDFSAAPEVLASLASFDGGDTAALRRGDLDASGLDLRVMEETSGDSETAHVDELVDLFAIEGSGLLTGEALDTLV